MERIMKTTDFLNVLIRNKAPSKELSSCIQLLKMDCKEHNLSMTLQFIRQLEFHAHQNME